MSFRVGIGFDVHRLEEGQSLILGGVNISHSKGTVAHSDGDVLIHALCDALLGSLSLGDIGLLFPDTEPKFKGIDSQLLFIEVLKKVYNKGFKVVNMDITLVLEKPKIQSFIVKMRKELSKYSDNIIPGFNKIELEDISIKATTNEKLGFIGSEEGVACHSVVLLQKV
jgi:2-C-methyl-D-erythritol 2,4-cyclodiphosphate synthase